MATTTEFPVYIPMCKIPNKKAVDSSKLSDLSKSINVNFVD